MRDMNDLFVKDDCKTLVHVNGYIFTIEDLYKLAISTMSTEELLKHKEQNYKF